jgi:hypothetical protein
MALLREAEVVGGGEQIGERLIARSRRHHKSRKTVAIGLLQTSLWVGKRDEVYVLVPTPPRFCEGAFN